MKRMVKSTVQDIFMLVAPPLAATSLMWLIRLNEITPFEFWVAVGLLTAAWAPYYRWKVAGEHDLPLFPMLSFMFWIYYALPLFWGDRSTGASRRTISEQSVEHAMLLAATGVACLWTGKWMGIGRRLVSGKVLDIYANREITWPYIRIALLLSIPLTFAIQSHAYVFGSGGSQAITILASSVPIVLFVTLFRKMLRHEASHAEILLIGVFLVGRFTVGIASGWLGASAAIMVICGIVYLYERRRIPTSGVLIVLAYVLFFQVGKPAFRKTFWSERVDASVSQRISFWSSESLREWQLTLENPTTENWRRLADQSLSRMSLLQQTAHVLEITPDEVPYQHGRMYAYMLVTLVPRALWPDKPSMNEANQFYQVAYGLTDRDDLDKVSIAVGMTTESFINFGWWGPFLVMIPLGIFFDYFQHAFLAHDSGLALNSVGIALIPSFLAIEAQMAQYLGGIVQCVAVALFVLWPVLHVQARVEKEGSASGTKVVRRGLQMPWAVPRRFL